LTAAPGFLARWSRRKRAAAAPVPAEPEPTAPPVLPAEAPPLPAFDPASLPAIETLTAASDIAAFLRAEVPAALRQAALRRIWTLDPGIRDFIGPADYAWDYNAPDGVPGFALTLGGELAGLLAQAIGEPRPEAPPGVVAAEAPAIITAEGAPAAAPPGAPEPAPGLPPEPAPSVRADPPPRRHGGAIPV